MNARMQTIIKIFAQRAGITWQQQPELGTWTAFDCELEKFAELIVQECVKCCEHESNDDEYDQFDMGQSVKAENIKTSIKQHFGVEE